MVVVTDRTDLEKQLSETAELTGEVRRAGSNAQQARRRSWPSKGPALVFAMIQKYRDTDGAGAAR